MEVEDKKQEDKRDDKAWWQPAIIIFARLSGWIIAPVLIGAFAGKWLDKKYGTEPWLFLAATGFSFLISMIGLIIEAKKEFGKIEKMGEKDKSDKLEINRN